MAGAVARFPVVAAASVPWLTVEQMREVDRLMVEELGITLVRMMENAGRNLALLARSLLGDDARGRSMLVLAGPGGNGGGGLVAARHLAVAGTEVEVRLSHPVERLRPVTAEQYGILERMGAGRCDGEPELVLDCLLGYGQRGAPRGETARLLGQTRGRRVLSLDVPSGLELETGVVHDPSVQAEATLTLAAPKLGLDAGTAGRLFLADISVPALVYERLGLAYASPFGADAIVELEPTGPSPSAGR